MTDHTDLAPLLEKGGTWTTAFIDGRSDQPQATEDSRLNSLRDALRGAGAPDEDVDAIVAAASSSEGMASPSARFLLAHEGTIALEEHFAGTRIGPELLAHGRAPRLLPLLRHRDADVRYLVVEAGREGANMRIEHAGQADTTAETDVDGQDYYLTKVRQGGWSQRRYQASAEETWKHNQSDVAEAVDRIVREHRPRFIALAGDVRARQLLPERLSPASRELIVNVPAHTRAEGSDDQALDDAIAQAVADARHGDIQQLLDRAASGDAESGAHGVGAVVHALQQAQVDTLLLDTRLQDADDTLLALDAAPWVATDEGESLSASVVVRMPAAEALARAAVLTGATVRMVEPEEPAEGEPRDDEAPMSPVAVLRWPEDANVAS